MQDLKEDGWILMDDICIGKKIQVCMLSLRMTYMLKDLSRYITLYGGWTFL